MQYSLCAELRDTPGHYFLYNDKAGNLLHGLVEISGQKMDKFIAASLFQPLGITHYKWQFDQAGNPSLLYITPSDLIKTGQLVHG